MADIQSQITSQLSGALNSATGGLSGRAQGLASSIQGGLSGLSNISSGADLAANITSGLTSSVNSGVNLAISSVFGGLSSGIGNTINGFIGKVTSAFSPTRIIGNTYTRQNLLNAINSRGDPITNFDWIAVVVNKSVSLNTTLPWYYINNIQLPGPSLSSQEKYVDGRMKKYTDMFTLDSATIKIFSDTTGVAFNFANDWMRAAYRDDNLYQLPSMYKKNIYVYILDSTRKIVVDVQLIGCSPSGWAGYSLGSESSGALETSMTVNVDDFRVNFDSNPTSIIASVNAAIGNAVGGIQGQISSIASSAVSSAVNGIRSALPF